MNHLRAVFISHIPPEIRVCTMSFPPTVSPVSGINYRRGVLLVLLAGTCWSSIGIGIRLINDADVWQILFYRSISLVTLLMIVISFQSDRAPFRAIKKAGWAGIIGGIALVFGFAGGIFSIQNTTVANAMFLFAAAPFATAVLGKIFLKERVRPGTVWSMLLAIAGISVMVWEGIVVGHMAGNIAALVSALGFSVFTVALRWRRLEETMPTVLLGGLFAIFVAAAYCQFQGAGLIISLNDLVISMTMGVVQAGAGLIFYTLGSRSVPAAELALLSMSEVVLGPIWAWLFIGETASIYTLVGGSVLLSAIVANALTGLRRKPMPLI